MQCLDFMAIGRPDAIPSVPAKQQIRDQLGDDGLWPESVHTYHFFPLRAFMDLAEAAWHSGTDLYHREAKPGKSLLSMFTAPLQYAYPDCGWRRSTTAGSSRSCQRIATNWRIIAPTTRDLPGCWANGYRRGVQPAGRVNTQSRGPLRSGLHAFLFGDAIPTDVTPPPPVSINFPVLGICMLRSTNGAMLSFDYGPSLGHGQPRRGGSFS